MNIFNIRMNIHLYCIDYFYEYMYQDGATPSYIASRKGHFDCLKLLIDSGADFNKARKVRN